MRTPLACAALAAGLFLNHGAGAQAQASNPYLAAGRRLYESLEFEQALDQLNRSRDYPGTTPAELVQINIYLGLVQYSLNQVELCRSSFRAALALEPKAQLPHGVSPKIVSEWAAIRAEMAQLDGQAAPSAAPPPPSLAPTQRADAAQVALSMSPPERSAVTQFGPPVILGAGVVLAGLGTYFAFSAQNEGRIAAAASTPQIAVAQANSALKTEGEAEGVLLAAAGAAIVGGVTWFIVR
jgi:hypothetical protein